MQHWLWICQNDNIRDKQSMIAVISCLIQVLKSSYNDGFLDITLVTLWVPPPLSSPSRAWKSKVLMNCEEIMNTLLSLMTSNLLEGNIWLVEVSLLVKNIFLSCGHEQFFFSFFPKQPMKGPYWDVGKMTKGTTFKKNKWIIWFFLHEILKLETNMLDA